MMGTKDIFLVSFIVCILLYNYIGSYISRRHGAKIPWWPGIVKSKDYTLYLIYIPYIALLVDAVITISKEEYIFLLALLGFILIFFSMYINFIARRELARCWSPLAALGKEQKLIKTGIYAKIRHPIYLSGLILLLGFALIAGNLYGLLFFILSLTALGIRIRKEERELITKFGEEYNEYARKTSILIPKLRGK
jgi:protein-S-isoprenylcysteine O-methyltransferase Ste14